MLGGCGRNMSRTIRAWRADGPINGVQQRARNGMHGRTHGDGLQTRGGLVGDINGLVQNHGERTGPKFCGQSAAAKVPTRHKRARLHGVKHVRDQRIVRWPALDFINQFQTVHRKSAGAKAVHGLCWKRDHSARFNTRRRLFNALVITLQ